MVMLKNLMPFVNTLANETLKSLNLSVQGAGLHVVKKILDCRK
jgi:hypothetical protein